MNIRNILPVASLSPISKVLLYACGILFVGLALFPYSGVRLQWSDFAFLFVLTTVAAAYRPGWIFLLLVSVLPIETVNIAPAGVGGGIRPYQFIMSALFLGLGIRYLARRPMPGWPRPHIGDALLMLIPIGSLPALVNAPDRGSSLRLSVILFTFYGLYALFRIYVRSSDDVRRILPFIISSSLLTSFSAVIQNILFASGNGFFEVMPGRPNALFAEPDWMGMYLVSSIAVFSAAAFMFASRSNSWREYARMKRSVFLFATLILTIVALVISVSRSAWLGSTAVAVVSVCLAIFGHDRKSAGFLAATMLSATVLASGISLMLTTFDLSGRAGSIGSGRQTITVSCENRVVLPTTISSAEELAGFGCRHIDLDEIAAEESGGRFVTTVMRDDPNVSIRSRIYASSIGLIREHPLLGIGWGSVSQALGTDGRGTGLNASDVFLEVWLGSGLAGILGLIGFLGLLAVRSVRDFFSTRGAFPLFIVAVFAGTVVFDLLNSGILLGFFWALLGVAGSYLFHEADFSETL